MLYPLCVGYIYPLRKRNGEKHLLKILSWYLDNGVFEDEAMLSICSDFEAAQVLSSLSDTIFSSWGNWDVLFSTCVSVILSTDPDPILSEVGSSCSFWGSGVVCVLPEVGRVSCSL